MEENWVQIRGYPNYMVSDQGNVFSKNINRNLSLIKNKYNGYYNVKLCRGGKYRTCLVHRLVAEHFIPNPMGKPEINHKNCDKSDNTVENLEWVTHKENQHHAIKMGINPAIIPQLTEDQINQIIYYFEQGKTQEEIAEIVGFSPSTVKNYLVKNNCYEPKKQFRINLTEEDKKIIISDYLSERKTIEELAEENNVIPNTIEQLLKREGVYKYKRIPKEIRWKIYYEYHYKGVSARELSKKYEVNLRHVFTLVKLETFQMQNEYPEMIEKITNNI